MFTVDIINEIFYDDNSTNDNEKSFRNFYLKYSKIFCYEKITKFSELIPTHIIDNIINIKFQPSRLNYCNNLYNKYRFVGQLVNGKPGRGIKIYNTGKISIGIFRKGNYWQYANLSVLKIFSNAIIFTYTSNAGKKMIYNKFINGTVIHGQWKQSNLLYERNYICGFMTTQNGDKYFGNIYLNLYGTFNANVLIQITHFKGYIIDKHYILLYNSSVFIVPCASHNLTGLQQIETKPYKTNTRFIMLAPMELKINRLH